MNHLNPHTSNATSASSAENPTKPDVVVKSTVLDGDPAPEEIADGDEPTRLEQVLHLHAAAAGYRSPLALSFPRLHSRSRIEPHGFRHSTRKRHPSPWLTPRETKAVIRALGVERAEHVLRRKERDPR